MSDAPRTATTYLRATAREKIKAAGLSFPHAAICYMVSESSQPTPKEAIQHLIGQVPDLRSEDFEPTVYL